MMQKNPGMMSDLHDVDIFTSGGTLRGGDNCWAGGTAAFVVNTWRNLYILGFYGL